MPNDSKVLVEIPENFVQLKSTDVKNALKWRITTRNIFIEYLNNRNYIISDCYSIKVDNKHKTYYLLEKL